MSSGANYFKIGTFVLLAFTFIAIGMIALGAGTLFRKSIPMETYFNESVQGLDVGSAVKYRGVQIGRVEEIDFVQSVYKSDPTDIDFLKYSGYIIVRVALDPATFGGRPMSSVRPIIARMAKKGLRVRLASQGLTGTAYLEADYLSPTHYPALEIDWVPTSAIYVPSAPSTINRFAMYAEEVLRKLERTDIDKIGASLDELLITLRKSLDEDISPTFAQLSRALQRTEGILASQEQTIEETLGNLRVISENFKDVSRDAKKYPSHILFGKPPPKIEPGK
jgi:paraquat-inducible protein B